MPSTLTEFDVRDERKLRNSLVSIEERVADSLYRKSQGAAEFVDVDGTTQHFLVGDKALAVQFLAGLDATAYTNIRVEDYWVKGKLYVELLYSGGSDVVNNYKINVTVTPVDLEAAVDAAGTKISDAAVSPPGTTKFLKSVTFGPYSVDANDKFFTLEVEREGATDSNTGDLYLFESRVRYYAEKV